MALAVVWPNIGLTADSQAELAKQSLNPVAALYSLPIQQMRRWVMKYPLLYCH